MRRRNFHGEWALPRLESKQPNKDRMRAVLLILIIVVIAFIVAITTGFLHVTQTRTAAPPQVNVNGAGVTARGGRPPAFDVETGTVSVATKQRQVRVPTVQVNPPSAANTQDQNVTGNAH
jgi:flagellar basal body-associated protein FliL